MNRVSTLAIWLISPMMALAVVGSISQAGTDPLAACINAAVIKLDGVPRSEVTASLSGGQANGSQQVNWQSKNGSSGFCSVSETGQVTQLKVDVSIDHANPVRSLTPAVSGAAPGTPVWVATAGGDLNLRRSPGGEIVSSVANGSQLTITGKMSGEWVEVTGGHWVSQDLITTFDPASMPNPAPTATATARATATPTSVLASQAASGSQPGTQVAQVSTTDGSGINVRSSPDGEILYGLSDGSTVTLTGQQNNGWVEIQGGGWVSGVYLR